MLVSGDVLICDSIDNAGVSVLKKSGMNVDYKPEITPDELLVLAKNYDVIVVRSRTKITKPVIDARRQGKNNSQSRCRLRQHRYRVCRIKGYQSN